MADWTSIVSSAAGTGNSIGSAITSSWNQKKTNEFNREMAEYAWEQERDMWNKQNEYNSPQAQMQRLIEAGLNPNLIYGSSANTGNATTIPKYQRPQLKAGATFPNLDNAILNLVGVEKISAETDLTKQAIKEKQIENQNKAIMTDILGSRAKKLGIDTEIADELKSYNITKGKAESTRVTLLNEVTQQVAKNETQRNALIRAQEAYINEQITDQQFDNQLHNIGLTKNDSKIMRMLVRGVKDGIITIKGYND